MDDLFGQVHSVTTEKTKGPDARTIIACRKLNLPSPTYRMSGWQAMSDGYIIFVNKVLGVKTKGKNKGGIKWGDNGIRLLCWTVK